MIFIIIFFLQFLREVLNYYPFFFYIYKKKKKIDSIFEHNNKSISVERIIYKERRMNSYKSLFFFSDVSLNIHKLLMIDSITTLFHLQKKKKKCSLLRHSFAYVCSFYYIALIDLPINNHKKNC
jgi:hypothetical protein